VVFLVTTTRSSRPYHSSQSLYASSPSRDVPPAEIVKTLRHLEPSVDPHQAWQYSNLHYLTLAHIVSTLSGLPFDKYVTQHIFGPLGMSRTMYNFTLAREVAGEEGIVDSFIRVGRNITRCGEIWRLSGGWPIVGESIEKACIGETVGVGWWSQSDGLNNAGPWGIITCGRDMVCLLPSSVWRWERQR
jgi:CubicO group peptidase (beta-lactamase class C family)